jgi:hypothetical protein
MSPVPSGQRSALGGLGDDGGRDLELIPVAFGTPARSSVTPNLGRVALIAALVSWAPLVVLSTMHGFAGSLLDPTGWSAHIAVHARSLVTVPILIIAEGICLPRLWRISNHFADAALVAKRRNLVDAIIVAQRAMASRVARLCIIALAFVAALTIALSFPTAQVPAWHRAAAGSPMRFSIAGWWHVLVALPLLLWCLNTWLWRLLVWTRLLWRITHCELRLLASHPDRTAGLAFLGSSLRAFAYVALGFSTIAASRTAQALGTRSDVPLHVIYFNVGALSFIAFLFIAPLTVFSPTLMRTSRAGSLAYGALAQRIGRALERRWLSGKAEGSDDILHVQDFSATIDLYSVVTNARGVRFLPASRRDLISLAGALAIPFLPVVLMRVPIRVVWQHVSGLLF